MANLTWHPSLETGHGPIDEEHRGLVEALARLQAALADGRGPAEVEAILTFLRDYTVRHFAMEEALMLQHRYPGAAGHFAAHAGLVVQVSDLLAEQRAGRSLPSEAVVGFLETWLKEHILGSDRELGAFLAARETSA